jgi:hypothetical protein
MSHLSKFFIFVSHTALGCGKFFGLIRFIDSNTIIQFVLQPGSQEEKLAARKPHFFKEHLEVQEQQQNVLIYMRTNNSRGADTYTRFLYQRKKRVAIMAVKTNATIPINNWK